MKKTLFALTATLLATIACTGQNVKLPAPQTTGGKTIVESLWSRGSNNEFSEQMLSDQDLSNLLFAACGVNRDNGKLTSPTASNKQEIRLFVFTADGVCEYLNAEHSLKPLVKGDQRALVAGRQEWVTAAPVVLLIVADGTKYDSLDERSRTMMAVDAGIVSENINLFCAGTGLVTRPRASMDADAIKALLSLDETQLPLMNNPVGYPKN